MLYLKTFVTILLEEKSATFDFSAEIRCLYCLVFLTWVKGKIKVFNVNG